MARSKKEKKQEHKRVGFLVPRMDTDVLIGLFLIKIQSLREKGDGKDVQGGRGHTGRGETQ